MRSDAERLQHPPRDACRRVWLSLLSLLSPKMGASRFAWGCLRLVFAFQNSRYSGLNGSLFLIQRTPSQRHHDTEIDPATLLSPTASHTHTPDGTLAMRITG